jgi:hypothetical protein
MIRFRVPHPFLIAVLAIVLAMVAVAASHGAVPAIS